VRPVASLLLASLALVSCVGDEPVLGAPSSGGPGDASSGPSPDAGPTADAGAQLPRIDRWDVSTEPLAGDVSACVRATNQAVNALAGSYVVIPSTGANARTATRPGAMTHTSCVANNATSLVATMAIGLEGALDAKNDNLRLLGLVTGRASPPASAPAPSATTLRVADRSGAPANGLTQRLCQERGKVALETVFAGARERWTQLGSTFLAIGGAAGTTVAVTCLALDLRAVTMNALTIDPAVDPNALLDAVEAQLRQLGAL